jgi:hypothetical protein
VAALLALAALVLWTEPHGRPGPDPAVRPPAEPQLGSSAPADGRLPVPAGLVGVPVRLADPAALAVVRPGDRIDLLAESGNGSTVYAARALVLDVAAADDGPVLYLALPEAQARSVGAAAASAHFAVIVHSR